MWAFGIQTLHLHEDFFWNLTLAEYYALVKAHEEDYLRSLHGSAMICAVIANTTPRKDKKKFTPQDFLPQPKGKNKRRKVSSAADMLRHIQQYQADVDTAKTKVQHAKAGKKS